MKKLMAITLASLFSYQIGLAAPTHQVFGYYTNWDTYGRNYQPADIPLQDVTAIMYAFAEIGNCAPPYATDDQPTTCHAGAYATGIQDYKLYSTDPGSDFKVIPAGYKHAGESGSWIRGNMGKVINEAHALKKPVILSIMGYSLSTPFMTAIDDSHRAAFIQSIIDFMNTVKADNQNDGFDGIDVDWEPNDNQWLFLLNSDTGIVTLKHYLQFMQDLRTALKKQAPYLWLTAALPASPTIIDKANKLIPGFWKTLSQSLDYANIMSYDYHGAFDNPKITNFLAPLHFDPAQPNNVQGRKLFNIDATIAAYSTAGMPTNKVVLGAPAYGRAVMGVPKPGLYQPFSDHWKGEWDQTGTYDYSYILGTLLGHDFTDHQYPAAGETAAYAADIDGGVWISYDNVNDITAKAGFIKQHQLAGMMFWSLSGDIRKTDPNFGSASLIHTASTLLK